jgi:hypothetical protein
MNIEYINLERFETKRLLLVLGYYPSISLEEPRKTSVKVAGLGAQM